MDIIRNNNSEERWLNTSINNDNYFLKIIYDMKKNWTEPYKARMLVFRRGTSFVMHFKTKTYKKFKNIGVRLKTQFLEQPFEILLVNCRKFETYFSCTVETQGEDQYFIKVDISHNAPIGWFQLCVTDEERDVTEYLNSFIVFNPFEKADDVYVPKTQLIEDYLLNPTTVVHCGSQYNYSIKTYQLKQFSVECIAVSSIYLNRMSMLKRTSPVHVSRTITAFVNSNDDNGLITGRWFNLSESGGTHPFHWKDLGDIYNEYLSSSKPVRYGQCFVFAGLVTALCRCVGIVCRTVTGFSIGHDDNNDGEITVILSEKDMSTSEFSETLWNFHCWNNAIMKRGDISSDVNIGENETDRWQHIDGTPQEKSEGLYRCGPYPLSLLKEGISKLIKYDGEYIYSSINGLVRYIIVDSSNEKVREYHKNETGKLLLTSSRTKEVIDITNEYKEPKTRDSKPARDKMTLELEVDKILKIGSAMKYKIKVRNSSKSLNTIMCLSVQLRKDHGENTINDHNSRSYEFKEQNYNCSGEFRFTPELTTVDLTQSSFFWELRCFDKEINKMKIIRKASTVKPLLSGFVSKPKTKWTTSSVKMIVNVKNETELSFKNVRITAYVAKDPSIREQVYGDFDPRKEKSFLIEFTKMASGSCRMIVNVSYGLTLYEIGDLENVVQDK